MKPFDAILGLIRGEQSKNDKASLVGVDEGGKPVDSPTASSGVPGEINPDLATPTLGDDEKLAVRGLARKLLMESDMSRRWQIRRVLRGRDYFDNRMNLVWDDGLRLFVPMSSVNLGTYDLADEEGDVDALLNWNVYQATGLYLISALGGGRPTVRFYPKNADLEIDVQTANASNDILDLFYRVNRMQTLQFRMAWLHYTDGLWFAYVRYVTDGQRFGFREEPVFEPQDKVLKPAVYACPYCGFENPEEIAAAQVTEIDSIRCMRCGSPLDPEISYQPPITTTVPVQTGTKKVPNGAEVMDIYGVPEVRTPPDAPDLARCGYLALQTEVDPAYLKALYPDKAEDIRAGSVMGEGTLYEERQARLSIKAGTWAGPYGAIDGLNEKITFTRIWLRPYMFYRIDDAAQRQKLLELYPKGMFVAFAGDTFCESRDESIDDYWVACHCYQGDGMIRPSIGEVLLDPQDAINDLMDAEIQAARHAVPFLLVNNELIKGEEFRQSQTRGGNMYPVQLKDQRSIGEQIFETGTPAMPASVVSLRQEIFGNISQWLSGALPGMTGQGDPSLKTARAYAQAREQALGRMGIVWSAMKEAYVKIAELAVKHFIENRTDDVTAPDFSPAGFKNKVIKISSLQGQTIAYAENDEAYPVSMAEKKDNILQLASAGIPTFVQALGSPDNYDLIKSLNALAGLRLPGEKARSKQLKEIQELLATQPVMPPPPVDPFTGQPIIDQLTGLPLPPQPPQPSVPIEPKTDDHAAEYLAGQAWLQSDEAFEVQKTNPMGYQNVVLHLSAHFDILHPPMLPMMPGPPPEGGGPPPEKNGPPGPS